MLLFFLPLFSTVAETTAITPADIEQLFKDKQFLQVLPVLETWKQTPPDGFSERHRLLLLGRCLLGLERHSEAIEALGTIQAIAPDAKDDAAVDAGNFLGDALAGLGRLDEAAEQWLKAAEMKAAVAMEALVRQKASNYSRNRIEMDGATSALISAHAKMASAQSKAKNPDGSITANLQQLNLAVDFPGMRETAVQTAELLLAGEQPREAFVLFLRALDSGFDRCFSSTARLPENQRQLNLVAKPPSAAITRRTLAGINQCLAALVSDEALPPEKIETLSSTWIQALAATYRPEIGTAAPFIALSESGLPESWRSLCRWKAANAFLREGAFHEVRKLLDEFPDNGLPIASHLARRKGMACIGEGDFPAATGFLRTAAGSEDAVLASQARLALAEALEALFDWDNAAVEYKKLASSSPVHWHRQEAAYALKRIGELRQLPLASDRGKVIVPLRDDRSTRGCWPLGYGADFHLLAAQNFITDRKGGAGPAMPCRFRTTDPKEKSRLWVTRLRDEDPVALWNPHEKSHTSANRDDYGEQYPLGNGPDLLMSCEIPAGRHVLALYFANDYNYYESQRAYTISVTDADRRLLCLAPVRDFGGGLYKRFAVQGPARLEFRIWRNMSINVILTGVFLDEWRLPVLPPCLTIAGQDEPLAKHYESLRLAITSATLMDFPALLEECDTLLDTLSTTAVLPSERTCRYWVKSRLLRLTGMPVNGIKALNAALVNYAEPGDVYRLVTDSFPEVATNQPSLAWYQPGTHELDILWHRYFALLDQQAKPPSLEKLLALSQDDDWRVTSTAMCEATKRLAKFKQLPISVNLATRLCIAMKIMDEAKYEEALDELNSLEDEARRIGDETVASRARNRLLSLSGRIDFVPDQLSQLHEKLVATGASEAACGVAALRTAKAFEKMRKFNEAKVWLDKVPSAAMSEKGRRILLERWETMESELNLLKGRKP